MAVHSPYHQIRGQVIANQPIMGRSDEKSPAQHVQMLTLAIILAEHPSCGTLAIVGKPRRMSAAIVQHVRRPVRQQHDISAHQFPGRPGLRILNNGPALEHDVVGNLVRRGLGPGHTPWRTVGAADLQLASDGDYLQEMAQPVDLGHRTPLGVGKEKSWDGALSGQHFARRRHAGFLR